MRRYDDTVDVRRGRVRGTGGAVEGPEQFLWKGRLWKVSAGVAQWVETGAWWQSSDVHAVLGADETDAAARTDLSAERGVWRVEASRGSTVHSDEGTVVFDLVFAWSDGSWRLSRCLD